MGDETETGVRKSWVGRRKKVANLDSGQWKKPGGRGWDDNDEGLVVWLPGPSIPEKKS